MAQDQVVLGIDEVYELSLNVLMHGGLSQAQAEPVARALTAGQRDECDSHGIYRLPGCVETVQTPMFVTDAEPEVTDVTPAFTRVDAKCGYSLLAFERAIPMLEAKAKTLGLSLLAIN